MCGNDGLTAIAELHVLCGGWHQLRSWTVQQKQWLEIDDPLDICRALDPANRAASIEMLMIVAPKVLVVHQLLNALSTLLALSHASSSCYRDRTMQRMEGTNCKTTCI